MSRITLKQNEKYEVYLIDGKPEVWVLFHPGTLRECCIRCNVSTACAVWDNVANAYGGIRSSHGRGTSFFFNTEVEALRFADLVGYGDISGWSEIFTAKLQADIEERKREIDKRNEEIRAWCEEHDRAMVVFAEQDADMAATSNRLFFFYKV